MTCVSAAELVGSSVVDWTDCESDVVSADVDGFW